MNSHPANEQPAPSWRDTPIRDADMSVRATNALVAAGFTTVGSICDKTDPELLRIPNLGRMQLKHVRLRLSQIAAAG